MMDPASEDRFGPLADVLAPTDWSRLRAGGRVAEWDSPCTLFEAGDEADGYDFVLAGAIEHLSPAGDMVALTGKGQFLRPEVMLLRRRWPLRVHARAGTRLLRVSTEALEHILDQDGAARRHVQRVLENEALRRVRRQLLSAGVPRAAIVLLVAKMEELELEPGQALSAEGQALAGALFIERGTIEATRELDGQLQVVSSSGPGDAIGLDSVLADEVSTLGYRSISPSKGLWLRREHIQQVATEQPMLLDYLQGGAAPRPSAASSPTPAPLPTTPLSAFSRADEPPLRAWTEPVWIAQLDEMDCGAACMAMVAHTYGRPIEMSVYQSMIQVSRDGASMRSLLRAAIATGFQATGARIGSRALANMHLPAIVLKKFHFVVVFEIDEEQVLIGDPARGIERVPRSSFSHNWSGMTLLLKPSERFFSQTEAQAHASFLRLLGGASPPSPPTAP